jgi:hypothetical protein
LSILNGTARERKRPVLSRRGFRLTAIIAGGLCVLAIAAGVIAFSYSDVRDLALTAGLSPRLARFYPLLFDAVLIVACAAAVTVRGVLRGFAWLAVLVIIGALAAADTVHAMSITVPMRPLEGTIAIAPWVVLLTGLTLLDAMMRRKPGRRTEAVGPVSANGWASPAGSPESTAGQPAGAAVVSLSTLFHDPSTAPAGRARSAAGQPAADASRGWITASQPAADPSPARMTASQPAADPSPAFTTASEPAADPSPAPSTASEPTGGADQPEATAGPFQASADQVAADPHERGASEG